VLNDLCPGWTPKTGNLLHFLAWIDRRFAFPSDWQRRRGLELLAGFCSVSRSCGDSGAGLDFFRSFPRRNCDSGRGALTIKELMLRNVAIGASWSAWLLPRRAPSCARSQAGPALAIRRFLELNYCGLSILYGARSSLGAQVSRPRGRKWLTSRLDRVNSQY